MEYNVEPERYIDVGEPLYLTHLLEEGKVTEAQQKSRVHPDIGNTTSYSGYLTVNKGCGSNLFFWYFPAQKNSTNAPLLLWLMGGPGLTSVYSLFMETGPLTYDDKVGHRAYSWNVQNNLLFIDQPVGTGFSFTRKDCYPKNDTEAGTELYSAIVQFYRLFPELVHNKFYISGYSYAGHYVPTLALEIHRRNPSAKTKIKLSGMAIGNGFLDPQHQFDWGDFLYQIGLIDYVGKEEVDSLYQNFVNHTKSEEWEEANRIFWTNIRKFYGNDLKWSGNARYRNSTRHRWCVDGVQAGYYKSAHNLHEVMVRNAGHSVAYDQPYWAYVLANSVTSSTQDNPLHGLKKC
ncbi:hypothetical protein J6590_033068 [Homalodisca vitripennis]|nr:hypothetical protein J6590_033068 [Homalodisca vitripennis]